MTSGTTLFISNHFSTETTISLLVLTEIQDNHHSKATTSPKIFPIRLNKNAKSKRKSYNRYTIKAHQ